jgi:hypothetical protein
LVIPTRLLKSSLPRIRREKVMKERQQTSSSFRSFRLQAEA